VGTLVLMMLVQILCFYYWDGTKWGPTYSDTDETIYSKKNGTLTGENHDMNGNDLIW
jgi:hypothetical protein